MAENVRCKERMIHPPTLQKQNQATRYVGQLPRELPFVIDHYPVKSIWRNLIHDRLTPASRDHMSASKL